MHNIMHVLHNYVLATGLRFTSGLHGNLEPPLEISEEGEMGNVVYAEPP